MEGGFIDVTLTGERSPVQSVSQYGFTGTMRTNERSLQIYGAHEHNTCKGKKVLPEVVLTIVSQRISKQELIKIAAPRPEPTAESISSSRHDPRTP